MGAVNPSLITNLIFKKRPVQNVLQQLAFAINGRAAVNQIVTRRIALAGGTGPIQITGTVPYYVKTNAPAAPTDYEYFAPPLEAAASAAMPIGGRGATQLPSNLTGTTVVLDLAWGPGTVAAGNIYRQVAVVRWRVGEVVTSVGGLGPGTLAIAATGSPVAESLSINIGAGATEVLPGDYLVVTAFRDASNGSDTFASSVTLVTLNLTYQETVTLSS